MKIQKIISLIIYFGIFQSLNAQNAPKNDPVIDSSTSFYEVTLSIFGILAFCGFFSWYIGVPKLAKWCFLLALIPMFLSFCSRQ